MFQAWKFFLVIPKMLLLRPARGGKVSKGHLVVRLDLLGNGQWSLARNVESSAQEPCCCTPQPRAVMAWDVIAAPPTHDPCGQPTARETILPRFSCVGILSSDELLTSGRDRETSGRNLGATKVSNGWTLQVSTLERLSLASCFVQASCCICEGCQRSRVP